MSIILNKLDYSGEEGLPPLLIAHGLLGSGRNWGALARGWSGARRVIAVDMRNHADSPWADEMTYKAMAEDLAAVIDDIGGRAVVLGHSMGAKAAMVLAATRPDLVAGVIAADMAPVAYTHDHSGYIAAMRAMDLTAVQRRSDADAALRAAAPDPGLRGFLLQNLALGGGGPRWRPNLDVLAVSMPEILGWPEGLPPYDGPALALAGGASEYVTPAHESALFAHLPGATLTRLEGAGHWLHAENPAWFQDQVAAFLKALDTA